MSLVTVKLHGFMANKYAPEVQLAGNTLKQIMNGLKHRFGPKFKHDIAENDWHLVSGTAELDDSTEEIAESELGWKLRNRVLHFVPVVIGAAKRFLQIIVGVVLIAIDYFTYGASGGTLTAAGIALIVGGVVSLVFAPKPPPGQGNDEDGGGSSVFGGAVNITSQGGVKPLIFGRVNRAASVIISSDFSTDQVAQNVDPGTPSTDVDVDNNNVNLP